MPSLDYEAVTMLSPSALRDAVAAALAATGKTSPLRIDDLAALDQVHTGGRRLTLALAEQAALSPGTRVLDVGGGIGGAARLLAARGCSVLVVERSVAFCHLGTWLTTQVGLSSQVRFVAGDAQALPLAPASVDAIWLQHVALIVPDKPRLFAELARVLRPDGVLALHEPVAGPAGPPHFPAPWAQTPDESALISAHTLRAALEAAGFVIRTWQDVTTETRDWAERQATRPVAPSPLGIHLILGPDTPRMLANVRRSLAEDRLRVVLAVAVRSPH